MVHLGACPSVAVFLSKRLAPREKKIPIATQPKAKLRVLYKVVHKEFPVFMPNHKSAPDCSVVYSVGQADKVVTQVESWELPGFGSWQVEAMALPIPLDSDEQTPAVVALIQSGA
jgi:hypothetical protein